MKNENKQPEDYYHGIYEYCGGEFDDSLGKKIHVWDDHSNPDTPCYKIQFVGSNEIHDNMDDSDIDWSEKHSMPESKEVESVPVKSAEEILSNRLNTTPELLCHEAHMRVSDTLLAMKEYASQTNPIEVIKK